MKRIIRIVLEYWYLYVLVGIAMILATLSSMVQPIIIMKIVDDVIIGGKVKILRTLLIAILVITVVKALSGYLKELLVDVASVKATSKIRKDLFAHVESLSMDYFEGANTGEIMARIKDDVDGLWNVIGYVGMMITEIVIYVGVILYCMFSLNTYLAIIPCIVMIILGTLAIVMEKKLDKVYGKISEQNATLTTIAEENLAGVRTVKAFARENYEIDKFVKNNSKFYELNVKQSKELAKYFPFFQFTSKVLPIVMAITGGILVIKGEVTVGVLLAFIEYCRNVVWPMESLGWVSNEMSVGLAALKKLNKIYSKQSMIIEDEKANELSNIQGEIEFENVSFKRDDKTILEDISFCIKPGKTLGIMGATGSGKSSIINLLIRLFDVDSGEIKVDGVNIKNMKLKQLRSNIATVMQEAFLFSDTIEENIKMGNKHKVDDDIMKESARLASADGIIDNMSQGYSTVIGEKGVGLSGGQKQRISIARALAKESPILVMDDSTSALDMQTERKIQNAIEEHNKTKIIVAHRISAVKKADEIIYLENGKIKERGTHSQLMSKKGLYYETYIAQYGS